MAIPIWGDMFKRKPFSLMGGVSPVEGTINQRRLIAPLSGVDPGLVAANARVASGTTIPQVGGGLNWKNFMNAAGKLKSPTGMDFGRASGRAGGPRPTAPSPRALGVDALEMASADDPRKKWWKQWQGLMGA